MLKESYLQGHRHALEKVAKSHLAALEGWAATNPELKTLLPKIIQSAQQRTGKSANEIYAAIYKTVAPHMTVKTFKPKDQQLMSSQEFWANTNNQMGKFALTMNYNNTHYRGNNTSSPSDARSEPPSGYSLEEDYPPAGDATGVSTQDWIKKKAYQNVDANTNKDKNL
jgi:hypothetical protein